MATNYESEGKQLWLSVPTGAESGDPVVVGDYLPGVCLTDANDDDMATVQTVGIFSLSADGDSAAISAGDLLYWDDKDTPLTKTAAGNTPFGIALEASTDATAAIDVMLNPKAVLPGTVGTGDLEANAVTSAKIAEDIIQRAEVVLDADAIKGMYASAEELVAAQGAEKALEFVGAVLSYAHDGTDEYTGGGDITIELEDGATMSNTAASSLLTTSADGIVQLQPLNAAEGNTLAKNKALEIENATGAFEGTGAGPLTVIVYYRVHDLS